MVAFATCNIGRQKCQLELHFLLTNLNAITSATNSPEGTRAFRKYLSAAFEFLSAKNIMMFMLCEGLLLLSFGPNLHPHLQLYKVSDLCPSIFSFK